MLSDYPHLRASEIFTSAVCPLNCKYCYIPKTKEMHKIHEEIIEQIIKHKLELPKDIDTLCFWGTEPILTLDYFDDAFLSWLTENYKNLRKISFSTSLILPIKPLIDFCNRLKKFNLELDLQISIDGPSFINEQNRGPNVTSKVLEHLWELCTYISNNDVPKMLVRFKQTLTPENMESLNSEDRVKEYTEFFYKIKDKIKNYSIPPRVRFFVDPIPTIMVPGNYTPEDGKLFSRFLRILHNLNECSAYDYRFDRAFMLLKEFFYDSRQSTCSGGDSNIGYDPRTDRYHLCHRTFFLDDPRYVKSILDMDKYKNWDVSLLEADSLEYINKNFVIPSKELPRFLYVMRGYHDFTSLRMSITINLIYELAIAGQLSRIYLDPKFAFIFAIFLQEALSCPMESIVLNGSPHVPQISLIRMFGNGAFEEIIRYHYERRR